MVEEERISLAKSLEREVSELREKRAEERVNNDLREIQRIEQERAMRSYRMRLAAEVDALRRRKVEVLLWRGLSGVGVGALLRFLESLRGKRNA